MREAFLVLGICLALVSLPTKTTKYICKDELRGVHCGCAASRGHCEMPCDTCCAPGLCDCMIPNPGR